MAKTDLLKELKPFYFPSPRAPVVVEVPKMNFLMTDGSGSPEGDEFQEALQALYGVCFAVKFMQKKGRPARDTKVMALEGLWSR